MLLAKLMGVTAKPSKVLISQGYLDRRIYPRCMADDCGVGRAQPRARNPIVIGFRHGHDKAGWTD